MCFAFPARIISVSDTARQRVLVEQAGVRMEVSATVLLAGGKPIESFIDQWVLLHQGFAMQQINSEEALSIIEAFDALSDPNSALWVEESTRHQAFATPSRKKEK